MERMLKEKRRGASRAHRLRPGGAGADQVSFDVHQAIHNIASPKFRGAVSNKETRAARWGDRIGYAKVHHIRTIARIAEMLG
jgi:hypothetical protein